jgi:signal transduction histidine kinase
MIQQQSARMACITDDVAALTQLRSGQLELCCERTDLVAILKRALRSVCFAMYPASDALITSLPQVPVWIRADPHRLEQVFANLLVNAAKYTGARGQIQLSVELDGVAACVRIRDNGIGISAELLPDIFELFVQADGCSRRANGGLGIGLTLARGLVERHGGTVTARSGGAGMGSEFTVRLPRSAT